MLLGRREYMPYYAHRSDDGRWQTIAEHLEGTAKLAQEYCIDLLKPMAEKIAKYHDIGKYAKTFQKRLEGASVSFCHAVCGAIAYQEYANQRDVFTPMLTYCIAGHHTGLMDGGTRVDTPEDGTLAGCLKRKVDYTGENDYTTYQEEYLVQPLTAEEEQPALAELLSVRKDPFEVLERYAFFTKLLFSCLTDADFLDTERFCNPDTKRGMQGDFKQALEILNHRFSELPHTTSLQQARSRIQNQAFQNAEHAESIAILDMPTGSGKTLCSLKLALSNAIKHHKKRVIYVIPYTSIIEQTADSFSKLFGDVLPVLQHHSNYTYETGKEEELELAEKMRKTCENWDAPLIITTSVQFFQSFYHYKSSALRKLHNLKDSILIFDEIHLIPTDLLQPCLRAVGYVTKYLNGEAIFLSATMPDYEKLFQRFLPDCKYSQLITDHSDFPFFKKCMYQNLGETDYETIAAQAETCENALIIVNRKKTAAEVYRLLQGKKFHLSSYMTPAHRSASIQEIKACLKRKEQITVVSTSLVEAGVDLDFAVVFRELAGLDNILQAGGRCNREGKRKEATVFIFQTGERPRDMDLQMRINKTEGLLRTYEDLTASSCIKAYYDGIFQFHETQINENTIGRFHPQTKTFSEQKMQPNQIPFRSYANSFAYIRSDTTSIVINDESDEVCQSLIAQLKGGHTGVRRSLQKYSVAVYLNEFGSLLQEGVLDDFGTGIYVLLDSRHYDAEIGLQIEMQPFGIFL